MTTLPYHCRHYTGVLVSTTCGQHIRYEEVAEIREDPQDGQQRRWYPCLTQSMTTCTVRSYYTDEEREKARTKKSEDAS
jgi:hypothetical protein